MTANLSVFYSNDITFVYIVPLENVNSFSTRLGKNYIMMMITYCVLCGRYARVDCGVSPCQSAIGPNL
jgi:hypothetical protein